MNPTAPFSIRSVRLGAMPIVDKYISMLGIDSLFQRHVSSDPRDKIPVFDCLSIVLRNVILDRHPLYKIGEWAIQRELGTVARYIFNLCREKQDSTCRAPPTMSCPVVSTTICFLTMMRIASFFCRCSSGILFRPDISAMPGCL